jgi:serine/threonine protein kinase/tetratricopeptide (TPR) repeat protein
MAQSGIGVNLTGERWLRLQSIFQEAADLSADLQVPFIDRATAGDADLRDELLQMLAHSGDATERIFRVVGRAAHQAVAGPRWIGHRFGPYRIIREIGRGGMGVVFEARRDDAEYEKTVALKVAPEWRDLERLRERFRNERQILAGLEHPNIARFLDGGTEDDVPFFAMEFVEGRPITEWSLDRNLTIRQRVQLFRQVCAAVHYAHQNLVVHRDLKPANILVDQHGAPRLLDFGIAKLLTPEPSDDTATTEAHVWTPDYTSPEQVRGGLVTVRTDVYSLGLILYELLSGERGQASDTSSPLALDRSICEVEPPLASVRAAAKGDERSSRELRGDLDTIVAMAIRKEPERRYGSVAELDADLGRYLEGHPVQARPNTIPYRVSRAIVRHRWAAISAILLAATLAGGVIATVYEARRAERRFQQVRKLANTFVFDVHDSIEDLPGATKARKLIVSTALEYLENLSQEAGGDTGLLIELAAAYEKIGDVQGNQTASSLGDTRAALASLTRAEMMLSPLNARGDSRAKLPLTNVEQKLAGLQEALGDRKAAAQHFGKARDLSRQLIQEHPNDLKALGVAANAFAGNARFAATLQDPGAALAAAKEAESTGQRMMELNPASIEAKDFLTVSYSTKGTAYRALGQPDLAAQNYRAAVAIREAIVRDHPDIAGYRRALLIAYGHLGDALGPPRANGLGDLAGARAAFAKAAEIAEWLSEHDRADRRSLFDLAIARVRLATVYMAEPGHATEALPLLRSAESILQKLEEQDPAHHGYRMQSLIVDRKTGDALAALGQSAEAAQRYQRSRVTAETFRGAPTEANVRSWAIGSTIAWARLEAQRGGANALPLADTAAGELSKATRQILGSPWAEAALYADLGAVYVRLKQSGPAAVWLGKAAHIWGEMKVAPVLEEQRKRALATVEAILENP